MASTKESHILITGGAGFVGSHAAELFSKNGWNVTILDNLSRKAIPGFGLNTKTYNWEHLSRVRNVRRVKGSVLDKRLLKSLVSDVNAVLHTAGQVAVTTSLEDPGHDFDTNMRGTFNVLEASRQSDNNISLAFCSTNKVYGENVNSIQVTEGHKRYSFGSRKWKQGIPENFPVDGCKHSPYGASKLSADLYVQEYGLTYGLRTGCFRMSCIYGDRQFGNEDQGWVAHFVISAMLGRPVTIYGDGKQVRDILFVDDVANAYRSFLESRTPSGIFNVGGGSENTISLLELVQMLKERHGLSMQIGFGPWRNSDQKVYISDISHASKTLKWRPKVGAEAGVAKLLKWARTAIRA